MPVLLPSIFFLILSFSFFQLINSKVTFTKPLYNFLLFLLLVLFSFVFSLRGLEHGWDMPGYLIIFDRIEKFNHIFIVYNTEYAFWLFNYLISLVSDEHYFYSFSVTLVTSLFLFFGVKRILLKYSCQAILSLAIASFLASSVYYLFITNGLRQSMAIAIFIFAISYRDEKFSLYFLMFMLSFFFHHSILSLFIVTEIGYRYKYSFRLLIIMLIFSALFGLFAFSSFTFIFSGFNKFSDISSHSEISRVVLFLKLFVHFCLFLFFYSLSNVFRLSFPSYFLRIHVLIGCVAWMLISLPDSSERILMYASYFEILILSLLLYNILQAPASVRLIKKSTCILLYFILLINYFFFVYLHPSIQFTIGDLSI